MSDLDISILHRALPPLLEEFPEQAGDILALVAIADGVRSDTAEDQFLSETELRNHLDFQNNLAQRQLSILTTNRDRLVGELENAGAILQETGADEALIPRIVQSANRDGNGNQWSAAEIGVLISELEQDIQESTPENTLALAERLKHVLEDREIARPELFLSEDTDVQHQNIPLNFVRLLQPSQQNILEQVYRGVQSGALSLRNPQIEDQHRWAFNLVEAMILTGIEPWEDLSDQEGDLELSFEDFVANRSRVEELHGDSLPEQDRHFAEIRARVFQAWYVLNQMGLEEEGAGVNVEPLARRARELTAYGNVQILLGAAGSDRHLTPSEAELLMARGRLSGTRQNLSAARYLVNSQQLVEELGDFGVSATPEVQPTIEDLHRDENNRRIITDMGMMIHGYQNFDEWIVENGPISNLLHFATWLCSPATTAGMGVASLFGADIFGYLDRQIRETDIFGGTIPTLGPTYLHYARDFLEINHTRRVQAVRFISRLMGYEFDGEMEGTQFENQSIPDIEDYPNGPNRSFLRWLETREEGEREITVANALEWMATYEERFDARVAELMATGNYANSVEARGYLISHERWDDTSREINRHYEILTGPMVRANRLVELHQLEDPEEATQAWFEFAQEIEEEPVIGFYGAHTLDGQGYWSAHDITGNPQWWYTVNPYFARTIYGALARQSTDNDQRLLARQERQESMGLTIRDGDNEILEKGGGKLTIFTPFMDAFWIVPGQIVSGDEISPVTFRNYSVENSVLAAEFIVTLPLFAWASKVVVGVGTAARSAVTSMSRSVVNFFGVRTATQGAVRTLSQSTGTLGQAATRTVTTTATTGARTAAVEAGTPVAANAMEQGAAAVTRPGFTTPFREAWRQVDGLWAGLGGAFKSPSHLLEGLKNVGAGLWAGARQYIAGNHPGAVSTAQVIQAGARRIYLPQAWGGFRQVVNWRNFFIGMPIEYYHQSRIASPLGYVPAERLEQEGIEIEGEIEQSNMDAESPRLIEDRTYRLGLPRPNSRNNTEAESPPSPPEEDSTETVDMDFTLEESESDLPNHLPLMGI